MDVRVSRKEIRYQPQGPVEVLVDNVFDLYPIYGYDFDPNLITDIEILDDPDAELIDRAMTAIVKQRGLDPIELDDGIQWAENILGEIPAPLILKQVMDAVEPMGPAVRVIPQITSRGTSFTISLTKSAPRGTM